MSSSTDSRRTNGALPVSAWTALYVSYNMSIWPQRKRYRLAIEVQDARRKNNSGSRDESRKIWRISTLTVQSNRDDLMKCRWRIQGFHPVCLRQSSAYREIWWLRKRGGHWGILERAKPKKNSSKTAKPQAKSAKTENRIENCIPK